MTQKQLFNQISTPNVAVPMGGDPPLLIHTLGGSNEQDQSLWSLHLWVHTNLCFVATDGLVGLFATPRGASPVPANVQTLANGVFLVAAPLFGVASVVKIADGIPLRGPLDIYVSGTGGDPTADPNTIPGVFGYVVRGDAKSREERRFFNLSSPIGDQVSNFSGGKSAVLIDGVPVDLQQTDETYTDEITLDLTLADPGSPSADATIAFNGGHPIRAIINALKQTVQIFDGQPARNAGILTAEVTAGEGSGPAIAQGYYVRS